jgi:glycine/D-amino acid oxidase-like deaminating enzyme
MKRQANKFSFDVVIVGSGAGAMTAALRAHDLGLSVVVVEQSDQYGGTSAVSGGGIWIPNNDQIAQLGGSDSPDDALAYLKAATGFRLEYGWGGLDVDHDLWVPRTYDKPSSWGHHRQHKELTALMMTDRAAD